MFNTDEDALICDLAETYHIYDIKSLPCRKVATFSCGLKNDSRIKMKISGMQVTQKELLISAGLDCLRLLVWMQTKDAVKGQNRPDLLLNKILGLSSEKEDKPQSFKNEQEFKKEWDKIIGKVIGKEEDECLN